MSYEISTNAKDDTTSTGKYLKVNDDDCQLLLQETSLEEDNLQKSTFRSSTHLGLHNKNGVQVPEPENQPESLPESSASTTANAVASTSREDAAKSSTTKSYSHRSFDLSFSSFMRFLSFRKSRKNKSKSTDTSSVNAIPDTDSPSSFRSKRNNTLPKGKQTKGKKGESSKTEKSSEDLKDKEKDENTKPTVFSRFVRTFSFLYKRNPKTSNFNRSRSVQNHRQTNSLPNIKYSSSHSRTLNSPGSNSSSSRPSVTSSNNVNHSSSSHPDSTSSRRDRAKSDLQLSHHRVTHSNHINAGLSKKPEPTAKVSSPVEVIDSPGKRIDFKAEAISKNLGSEVVLHSSADNRRRHLVSNGLQTPGVNGIANHLNSCYLNSVVQCLNNTDLFAEYFVLNHYRDDLNRLSSKKYGTRGELTEHMAILLKSLWSSMYSSEISIKFKKVVAKFGTQYNGNEQHDAQEFLLWLLDKCHEDLTVQSSKMANNKNAFLNFNKKANKSNSKKNVESQVTDETAAIESLAKYQTVNSNSIVYDLFQGQLRSMVVCRNCDHYSKTFDPYLCLSLPVPIRLTLTIFIHAICLDSERNQSGMYGISIEAAGNLRELRDKVSRMLKIPEKRLPLLQIDKKLGMHEFANDTCMIQEIFEDFETIYAIETPIIPDHDRNPELLIDTGDCSQKEEESNMYQQMLTIVWLNRVGIGQEGPIFGPFFTAVVSRELTFRQLQTRILSTMSAYLIGHPNVNVEEISRNINLRLRIIGGLAGKEYLLPEVDHPLFVPTVEAALSKTEDRRVYRGPHHLKIMVEWDFDNRQSVFVSDDLIDVIHGKSIMFMDKSVERAKELSSLNNRTTLRDCLDIYFREESLTAENAWMCPMCNSRQQCGKQLSVWSLPNILIIHLKRFRYMSNVRRIKINTMVEYPQNGLDMLNYVAHRNFSANDSTSSQIGQRMTANCSKFSHKRKLTTSIEETTFNLYGVVCHHGTMQGGHYTAYCKNPVDNCWYLFDDTKVIPVLEEAVVTADAYLLFYQKSSLSSTNIVPKVNPSTSSISSGYLSSITCSSNFNLSHWSFQMPPFNYYSNGNNGNGNGNNSKSNTLPNRRVLAQQTNRPTASNAPTQRSNSSVKSPNNYEATKHSKGNTSFYVPLHNSPTSGSGMTSEQASWSHRSSSASNGSSYSNHNTFPRIKSRQASH